MKYWTVFIGICLILLTPVRAEAQSDSRTESLLLRLSAEKFNYMNPEKLDQLKPLLDDRMIFIHSNGMTETKTQMIQDLTEGKWKIHTVDVKEASVRVYKNNTAILVGKGTFHVATAGNDLDLELYYTEVWTHLKKGWVLASRHALRL